jgi:hypothetical protein
MGPGGGQRWGPALFCVVTCRLGIARRGRGMGWRREPSGPPLFRVVACRLDVARRGRGVRDGFWRGELSGRAFLRVVTCRLDTARGRRGLRVAPWRRETSGPAFPPPCDAPPGHRSSRVRSARWILVEGTVGPGPLPRCDVPSGHCSRSARTSRRTGSRRAVCTPLAAGEDFTTSWKRETSGTAFLRLATCRPHAARRERGRRGTSRRTGTRTGLLRSGGASLEDPPGRQAGAAAGRSKGPCAAVAGRPGSPRP